MSDLVLLKPLPEALKQDMDAYAACLAGALLKDDYLAAIRSAGFSHTEVASEAGYDFGDPTPAQVEAAKVIDANLTIQDLSVAAAAVSSIRVSAVKPLEAEARTTGCGCA